MGWGLGSTIKASERRTLFRRRLALRFLRFFETTVGVFSSPASIALCIAVRNASSGEHRPWALRFGKALWSVHQDRLLVARPSQSRGIGS